VGISEGKQAPQCQAGDGYKQKEEPVTPHQFNEFCHEEERLV
jgi:hypothetical protein